MKNTKLNRLDGWEKRAGTLYVAEKHMAGGGLSSWLESECSGLKGNDLTALLEVIQFLIFRWGREIAGNQLERFVYSKKLSTDEKQHFDTSFVLLGSNLILERLKKEKSKVFTLLRQGNESVFRENFRGILSALRIYFSMGIINNNDLDILKRVELALPFYRRGYFQKYVNFLEYGVDPLISWLKANYTKGTNLNGYSDVCKILSLNGRGLSEQFLPMLEDVAITDRKYDRFISILHMICCVCGDSSVIAKNIESFLQRNLKSFMKKHFMLRVREEYALMHIIRLLSVHKELRSLESKLIISEICGSKNLGVSRDVKLYLNFLESEVGRSPEKTFAWEGYETGPMFFTFLGEGYGDFRKILLQPFS